VCSPAGNAQSLNRRSARSARLTRSVVDVPFLLHRTALSQPAEVMLRAGSLQLNRTRQHTPDRCVQALNFLVAQ